MAIPNDVLELMLLMRIHHITQKDLAEHMGLSREHVCAIMNGNYQHTKKGNFKGRPEFLRKGVEQILEERGINPAEAWQR